MTDKPLLGMYWAGSCGGCEISLVNLGEALLDIDRTFNFMFCPCLMDTKIRDIEALEDNSIHLMLFNGSIRNEDNEHMAYLLRAKSKILVAYGSCAYEGCIPALANLTGMDEFMARIYNNSPSGETPSPDMPSTLTAMPEGDLELPALTKRVMRLKDIVEVDYTIPGCPPEHDSIMQALTALSSPNPPAKGSVLGGTRTIVCEQCPRTRAEKKITRFHRLHEIVTDPSKCLAEQGIVCMGLATRGGCGAKCPQANMPCTGCYGPPEGSPDQGLAMVGALGSMIDPALLRDAGEDGLTEAIRDIMSGIADPAGTFYKYSMAGAALRRHLP